MATNSVVTKDLAPCTVVGEIPAKKIGERNPRLSYEWGECEELRTLDNLTTFMLSPWEACTQLPRRPYTDSAQVHLPGRSDDQPKAIGDSQCRMYKGGNSVLDVAD